MKQSYPPPTLSLHDALALGEVESGLPTSSSSSTTEHDNDHQLEEIQRLPILLRLLSAARPLSSIPSFGKEETTSKSNDDNDADAADDRNSAAVCDALANRVVARLEDVAATYPVAEGVDVVACHLAPSICRHISRVAPLKRKRREQPLATAILLQQQQQQQQKQNTISQQAAVTWDTHELKVVGANPRSSYKRRRLSTATAAAAVAPTTTAAATTTGKAGESDLELMDGEKGGTGSTGVVSEGGLSSDDETTVSASRVSRRGSEIPSAEATAVVEDSQEEVVTKTLSDLTLLVTSSLEPLLVLDDNDGDADTGNINKKAAKLLLTVVDSALSEPARAHSVADSVRGVMTGSDLGSTVASLMHHAPVLRHQHVANALCRAALPQTADLIKRMGANCPSAVPSLLRGCIDAYKIATAHSHSGISNAAKEAIQALADLSEREASRVRNILQQGAILVDLQLKLAICQDQLSALCLLLQHLSNPDETAAHRGDLLLKTHLERNPYLLILTLDFLKEEILSLECTGKDFGRTCLLLCCWTWLIMHCDISTVKTLSGHLSAFQKLGDKIEGSTLSNNVKHFEKVLSLFLCASLLTQARLLTSSVEQNQTVLEQCNAWVKKCFESRTRSVEYGTLVVRFACSLEHHDIEAFSRLLQAKLRSDSSLTEQNLDLPFKLERGLLKGWESLKDIVSVETLLEDRLSLPLTVDAAALIHFIEFANSETKPLHFFIEKSKMHLSNMLKKTDEKPTQTNGQRMAELITKAVAFFADQRGMNMPIVSPLQLECRAANVDLEKMKYQQTSDNLDWTAFYQVLYWFAFMDVGANSLFDFDPRVLPLKEMLSFSRRISCLTQSLLPIYLEYYIDKHCPDVLVNLERWELVKDPRFFRPSRHKEFNRLATQRQLSKTLKAALLSNAKEKYVSVAERSFIIARGILGDADLCTVVVSAFLSTPNSPPPFCTYSMLCRDPLVLLKAPMQTWRYSGLRRVGLSVILTLMEANSAIVPKNNNSSDELVAACNLLLVRGLIVATSGSEDSSLSKAPQSCSMTTNFVRRIIANNPGLVGQLVKQSPGLSECAQDWLVEFVPETMDDSSCLINVFTEGGSVETRLMAAAAIIRIAIAHGHRDEATAERLVYSALSQLISSFFLVVGPVGVPVNVMIGDGFQDFTQTSRRATFRILKSLVNVRGRQRPRLRNECGMALHKLAGLCKDPNSLKCGAGPLASRRKALLREIFDAVSKASNAMGSGVDL